MHKHGLFAALFAAGLFLNVAPALAEQYDSDTPAAQDQRKSGAMNDEAIKAQGIQVEQAPTDEAPAMVPGSATPGQEMQNKGEIEATHGGARDATGGYDAAGSIQNDGDAEADASAARGSEFDYNSPLHQRNLQEAMNPKNAHYKSKGAATGSTGGQEETHTPTEEAR